MARQALRLVMAGLGMLAALAPVSFARGTVAVGDGAACSTCCPQAGPTCVICGTQECVKQPNYYEGKIGPDGCVAQT